jgi:hypothetical protein
MSSQREYLQDLVDGVKNELTAVLMIKDLTDIVCDYTPIESLLTIQTTGDRLALKSFDYASPSVRNYNIQCRMCARSRPVPRTYIFPNMNLYACDWCVPECFRGYSMGYTFDCETCKAEFYTGQTPYYSLECPCNCPNPTYSWIFAPKISR